MIRSEKKRIDGIINQLDKITDEVLSAPTSEEKQMWRDKAFRLQTERTNVEKQIAHLDGLKRYKPELVSHTAILDALDRLGDGFKGLPVTARLRLIKGVLADVRINKDYPLTLRVKNPNLLGFREDKESIITGAIGSPTLKIGSGGGIIFNLLKPLVDIDKVLQRITFVKGKNLTFPSMRVVKI